MVLSPTLAIYVAAIILLIMTQIEIEAFVQPTKHRESSTTTTTHIKGFLDNFIINRKDIDDSKPNHRVYKKWKSKEEEARRKANTYQGKKITVRQDEDNAMWFGDDSSSNKIKNKNRKQKSSIFGNK